MPKRIIMSEGKLIEVIEELKSSGNWIVPPGCRRVDIFLVGGGAGGEYGGGRDGSDGKTTDFIGGIGQHSTTRAFGEPTGKLFSSGGDAASSAKQHADPNTGNGGNGHGHYGGNGGSGIIILRYKKHEL